MPISSVNPVLTVVALLGACVWIGGFIVIVLVVFIARAQLDSGTQVAFFRGLGRRYLPVASVGLALALGAGGALLSSRRWDATAAASVALAAALVLSLVIGVVQARAMTRMRGRLVAAETSDGELAQGVERAARRAAMLRALIGIESLALLVLAGVLASSAN